MEEQQSTIVTSSGCLEINLHNFVGREEPSQYIKHFYEANQKNSAIDYVRIIALDKEQHKEFLPHILGSLKNLEQQIKTVEFSRCVLDGETLKTLLLSSEKKNALRFLMLNKIVLDDNSLDADALLDILSVVDHYKKQLRFLSLNDNPLGDEGIKILSEWLKPISLPAKGSGTSHLRKSSSTLMGTMLESMGLMKSIRKDAAAIASAHAGTRREIFPALHSLALKNTQMTDKSLNFLIVALKDNNRLSILKLENNELSVKRVKLLLQKQHFPSLDSQRMARQKKFYQEKSAKALQAKALQLQRDEFEQQCEVDKLQRHLLTIAARTAGHQEVLLQPDEEKPASAASKLFHDWLRTEIAFFADMKKAVDIISIAGFPLSLKKMLLVLLTPLLQMEYVFHKVQRPVGEHFSSAIKQLVLDLSSRKFRHYLQALKTYESLYQDLAEEMSKEIKAFVRHQQGSQQKDILLALLHIEQLTRDPGLLALPWKHAYAFMKFLQQLATACEKENRPAEQKLLEEAMVLLAKNLAIEKLQDMKEMDSFWQREQEPQGWITTRQELTEAQSCWLANNLVTLSGIQSSSAPGAGEQTVLTQPQRLSM